MKPYKELFLILMFLSCSFLIRAQDRYKFMVIEFYMGNKSEITISMDGQEIIEKKPDFKNPAFKYKNVNVLLATVKEYQELGWELMNFDRVLLPTGGTTHYAYMRQKE